MNTNTDISEKLIRSCFESSGYAGLVNDGDNHDSGLRFVMDIFHLTQDEGVISRLIATALGDDYSGNTLDEVPQFIGWCMEKGIGDDLDMPKGKKSLAVICLEVISSLNVDLFHDGYSISYITFRDEGCGPVTYLLDGRTAKTKLKGVLYRELDRTVPAQTFSEVMDTLSARALFDGVQRDVYLRCARHGDKVIINLADDKGRVVVIDGQDFEISKDSPVAFLNSPNMEPLPEPQKADHIVFKEFQDLFGLSDQNYTRVLAFMLSALKPEEPYLLLIIQGEQGSGKSELSRTIKMVCDPSKAPKARLPDNPSDLTILAKDMQLMVFDNLSGMTGKMSDALCTLLTGGANAKRKLYTDDELHISYESAPVIINGIAGIANRPDLLERSISINLPPMPEGQRKTEDELRRALEVLRPKLFCALISMVSEALKNFDNIKTPTTVRMTDVAKWLIAAEPASGLEEGAFLKAIEDSQNEIIEESMLGNSLVIALINFLPAAGFEGKIGELYHKLRGEQERYDPTFPKTAAHLSKTLKRLRPAMSKIGLRCEFGSRDNKGQNIKIWLEDQSLKNQNHASMDLKIGV